MEKVLSFTEFPIFQKENVFQNVGCTHSESLVFIGVSSGPRLSEIRGLSNNHGEGYEKVT